MKKVKLRDYQEECVQTICSHFKNNNKQLIQIPTGGGKTYIFLSYISRYSNRSLIIVPSRELLEQVDVSSLNFMPKGSIYARKEARWVYRDHVLLTAQSLNYEATESYLVAQSFDTIIIDEAHRAQAPTYTKFLDKYLSVHPNTKILGFTATPERHDRQSLLEIFGSLTFERNIVDMINDGNLCDIKSFRIKTGHKFDTRKLCNKDFAPIALKDLNNDTRNNLILKTFQENCGDKKTIIFCVSVDHATRLANAFVSLGICCEAIYGSMSYKERKAILERFKSGKTQVVTNCQLLTEGFDEPSIQAMIIARPTKSKTLYCQMIGRGLRNFPGKNICDLYELTDNVHNICTFCTAANPEFEYEYEYQNGQRLTELNKTLEGIHIENISLTKEKISLYQKQNQYLSEQNATENQIDSLKNNNINFYEPISAIEAGYLLWKDKLKKSLHG